MDNQPAAKRYQLSSASRMYIFVLLFLLYFFDYVDRTVVTSLFPFIQRDWGISDAECGMLVSAVYWSILIFTFPVSILVDRWSRKKTIGLMGVFWSLATAACAFMPNFKSLFGARTAIGIGEAGYAPGGSAMISGIYPEEKRARMLGIWNASIPLGSAVGIALGGIIAKSLGWQHAFGLVAIPGLIVAIMFFFVKDYKTVELVKTVDEGASKKKMNFSDISREFLRTPSLWFTYLGFAAVVFVTTSIITWLPTYFYRIGGIAEDQAGLRASAIMALAIVGAPLGGFLADMWYKKDLRARLLFSAISILITAVFVYLSFSLLEGLGQYLMLLLVGIAITSFIPAALAVCQDVVHAGLRATSVALAVVIQHLLGSSLGPIVTGAFSDAYGIHTAMTFLPIYLVVAAALFFAGSFFYKKDYAKVEKIELQMEP
ncbi:MAG: MFS transporter [Dehalococcoidia bacterium]